MTLASLAPGSSFGWPGGWVSDRVEAVRHYKHWVYAGVQARATELGRHEPHIDYVIERPSRIAQTTAPARDARVNAHTLRARHKGLSKPRDNEELHPVEQDHPLVQLLAHPNPYDTLTDLCFEHELFSVLTGNAYWWAPRNLAGFPSELWVIPSHWVFPMAGRERLIDGYWLRPYGGAGGPGEKWLPAEEVIHFKDKHPLHKVDGYSPLTAGAEIIDVSEAVNTSRWSHFERGMQPGLHIELGELSDMDDADMDRYYAKLLNRFQGRDKHGLPIVTQKGGKVSKITMTPEEMGYYQSAEQLMSFVLAILRVPKELIGLQPIGSDLSWYAPLRMFCRFVIGPRLHGLGAGLSKRLGALFDPPVRIWYDDPTPDDPKQVNEDLRTDLALQAVTPNEVRAIRGREPYEGWGDRPMVSGNQQPAQFPGDPSPAQPEKPLVTGGQGGQRQGGAPPVPGSGSNRLAAMLNGKALANGKRKGDWKEEDHPRGEGGQFGSGGSEASEGPEEDESDEEDTAAQEQAEAQEAWADYDRDHLAWKEETDALVAEHEEAHAAWEKETEELTAAYQQEQSQWQSRQDERQERRDAVDLIDLDKLHAIANPTGLPSAPNPADLKALAGHAEAVGSAWDRAYGAGGKLEESLSDVGASEKELAKVTRAAEKGRAALGKAAVAYEKAAQKHTKAAAALEKHRAQMGEEPIEPDEPDEPPYPDGWWDAEGWDFSIMDADDPELTDEQRTELVAAQEEYAADMAAYETAVKEYNAAHDAWQDASEKWGADNEKETDLENEVDECLTDVNDTAGAIEDVWNEQQESVQRAVDLIQARLTTDLDREEEKDPEPDEPEMPEEPSDPELPDEPEPPDMARPAKEKTLSRVAGGLHTTNGRG